MRGNRVRNIVNELYGEKIDIVRFNDDVREYIKNALSPAKVSEIKLDKDNMKAEVIVDDDQLSLAIGKHGQNVRLASRLIGWELDIRTKTAKAQELLKDKPAEPEAEPEEPKAKLAAKPKKKEKKEEKKAGKVKDALENLSGLGEKTILSLKDAGIETIADLIKAGQEGLTKIKGIGEKKAAKLIEQAKKLK